MSRLLFEYSILNFLILFVVSEVVRRYFVNKLPLSTSAGSIVMGIGIFSLYALHRIPITTIWIEKIIALELFIIWIHLARIYFSNYQNGTLIQSSDDQFGIGTWVAGSSVLAISCYTELSWHIIAYILLSIAFVIWIIYLKLLYSNFIGIRQKEYSINGIILLSTVSTQSIVIALHTLFMPHIPILINQLLISFGYFLYFVSLFILIKYLVSKKVKKTIINWSNSNSIIHGALSITGLASLETNSINYKLTIVTWIAATCLFVLVEGISIIKMLCRIKSFGWMQGLFIYDISQWSRVFTYGMYYAFTLSMFNEGLFENNIMYFLIQYGQYVVFGILSIEILLWCNHRYQK